MEPVQDSIGQPAFGHKATVMPLQLITDEDIEILEAFQAAGSMPITTHSPSRREPGMDRVTHDTRHRPRLESPEPDNPAMYALYKTATTALRDAAARIYEQE